MSRASDEQSDPATAQITAAGGERRCAARTVAIRLMPLLAPAFASLGGCLETDAWLWDPSVVGRWEETPTVTPIIERIDVIERDTGEFVDPTSVRPEDLVPQPIDYRVNPGDVVNVTIFDLEATGTQSPFQLTVDNRGNISVPRVGPIQIEGLTAIGVQQAVEAALIEANILADPTVSVTVPGRRQATFGIYGNVAGTGRYSIPFPDYRLLDAITDAGGIPPSVRRVFIIRQVTVGDLEGDAEPDLTAPTRRTPPERPDPPDDRPSIDDILERLSEPEPDTGAPAGAGATGNDGGETTDPGAFSEPRADRPSPLERRFGELAREFAANEAASARDRERALADRSMAPSAFQPADGTRAPSRRRTPTTTLAQAQPQRPAEQRPPIDLPDSPTFRSTNGEVEPPTADADAADQPPQPRGRWEFIDGRWIRVVRRQPDADVLPGGPDPLADTDEGTLALVTQRVIEVPTAPLQRGIAKFNVVIRPGDLIHVPIEATGLYYMTGPGIARPGTYNISPATRLTLMRAVASANGLSAIGIPERVDLTRIIDQDTQATIRLNFRAIAEGTQPDIVIKPDDLLNFGTNFWATPLAVIRNGFRASYGFGFLLDRNFGNDVFGAPPSNVGGG